MGQNIIVFCKQYINYPLIIHAKINKNQIYLFTFSKKMLILVSQDKKRQERGVESSTLTVSWEW